MDYVIIVNDAGELKSISASELEKNDPQLSDSMDALINIVLDARASHDRLQEIIDDIDNDDGNTPVGIIGGVR